MIIPRFGLSSLLSYIIMINIIKQCLSNIPRAKSFKEGIDLINSMLNSSITGTHTYQSEEFKIGISFLNIKSSIISNFEFFENDNVPKALYNDVKISLIFDLDIQFNSKNEQPINIQLQNVVAIILIDEIKLSSLYDFTFYVSEKFKYTKINYFFGGIEKFEVIHSLIEKENKAFVDFIFSTWNNHLEYILSYYPKPNSYAIYEYLQTCLVKSGYPVQIRNCDEYNNTCYVYFDEITSNSFVKIGCYGLFYNVTVKMAYELVNEGEYIIEIPEMTISTSAIWINFKEGEKDLFTSQLINKIFNDYLNIFWRK